MQYNSQKDRKKYHCDFKVYFSTAKLVQRLNNEINMLLYFREFLFFHTFSISFFSKCSSWIFKHNWMSNKTAASQDRPIVGRETLYFLQYCVFRASGTLVTAKPRTPRRPTTLNTNGSSVPCVCSTTFATLFTVRHLCLEHDLWLRIVGFVSCHSSFYTSSLSEKFSKL